jgi:hypothetical protein
LTVIKARPREHRPRCSGDGAVSSQLDQQRRDTSTVPLAATTPNSAAWPRRALIAVMSVFNRQERKDTVRKFWCPVDFADAGMRGGGRALSDG